MLILPNELQEANGWIIVYKKLAYYYVKSLFDSHLFPEALLGEGYLS